MDLLIIADDAYDQIKDLYLNGGLDSADSPMDSFEFVSYSETIYPTQLYTNKNYTRQRTTFSFDWRDDRANRTEPQLIKLIMALVTMLTQSVWPLDVSTDWPTQLKTNGNNGYNGHFGGFNDDFDFGILLNNYNFYYNALHNFVESATINTYLRPAPTLF